VTIAFIWLLIPYYSAVFWAVILAIIFFPVHKRLGRLLGGCRSIAAPSVAFWALGLRPPCRGV
jgi:predicted PurR-regulated permease PerM